MTDFSWEGNSKKIYDTIVSMIPLPFRKISEKNLTKALVSKTGEDGTITEDIIIGCVKEVTPKPFLSIGMKQIKHLLKND